MSFNGQVCPWLHKWRMPYTVCLQECSCKCVLLLETVEMFKKNQWLEVQTLGWKCQVYHSSMYIMDSKFKVNINKISKNTILYSCDETNSNAWMLILYFYIHNLLKTPKYKTKNYATCGHILNGYSCSFSFCFLTYKYISSWFNWKVLAASSVLWHR